jgi:hypothetical protein
MTTTISKLTAGDLVCILDRTKMMRIPASGGVAKVADVVAAGDLGQGDPMMMITTLPVDRT